MIPQRVLPRESADVKKAGLLCKSEPGIFVYGVEPFTHLLGLVKSNQQPMCRHFPRAGAEIAFGEMRSTILFSSQLLRFEIETAVFPLS